MSSLGEPTPKPPTPNPLLSKAPQPEKRGTSSQHRETHGARSLPRLLLACFWQSPDGKEIREHLAELIATLDRTLRTSLDLFFPVWRNRTPVEVQTSPTVGSGSPTASRRPSAPSAGRGARETHAVADRPLGPRQVLRARECVTQAYSTTQLRRSLGPGRPPVVRPS